MIALLKCLALQIACFICNFICSEQHWSKHFIKMPRRLSTACWHRCKVHDDHSFNIDAQPSFAFMKHLRQCSNMHNSREIEYFQNQRSAYSVICIRSLNYLWCIKAAFYKTSIFHNKPLTIYCASSWAHIHSHYQPRLDLSGKWKTYNSISDTLGSYLENVYISFLRHIFLQAVWLR